jgi:predicted nucleic acid-binding protein
VTAVSADTSFFMALVDRKDAHHAAAEALSRAMSQPMLTSNAILLELGAAFCRRDKRLLFLRIVELLRNEQVEIVHVDQSLHDRGTERFAARNDKDWSLADGISFLIMEERGISDAASSDEHFEQAGFVALHHNPKAT